MSVITELDASFRNRQASYKMVTVLAMPENCSANGVARLDDVTRYFRNFYESRQKFGKKPEKDKVEMFRFEIEEWKELPQRIAPLQYGVYDKLFTTLPLLLSARELPELKLQTEEEIRLWKELRRVTQEPHVRAAVPARHASGGEQYLDSAKLKDFVLDGKAILRFAGQTLTIEKQGMTRSWSLEELKGNRVRVFKDIREFVKA